MAVVRKTIATVIAVCMMSSTALAQQPQPQPQPQPQAQQAPWYRFTLNDGRVIDVQVVGGDATSYHILQTGQLYSIPKANVVGSIALPNGPQAAQPQPQPMYAPQPQPQYAPQYAPPPPPPPAREDNFLDRNPRAAGWFYFGSFYLVTVMVALAKRDEDRTANAGLIPVAGPLIWALSEDQDDAFEDGWDWLAATDGLIQAAGLYLILSPRTSSSNQVTLTPTTRRDYGGIAIMGTF